MRKVLKRTVYVVIALFLALFAIGWAEVSQGASAAPPKAVAAVLPTAATPDPTATARWVLTSYGYTVTTDAQLHRAVRHWQHANHLVVDGIVGPQTLASFHTGATVVGSVPARRIPHAPSPAPPQAPGVVSVPDGDVEAIIRDVWPDDLEDWAVRIATRESRLTPTVINRNGNATGLFQIMWTVHRSWLCPDLGICAQSDLQDARTNAVAALALYNRAGGPGPWSL